MASTPYLVQAPVLGQKVIDNASGTSDQTVFTAGANGAFLHDLKVFSGPTTAPGGTYTVRVKINDGGSVTTIIHTFALVNTVDTQQAIIPLGLELQASAQIRIAVGTTLASGATLDCTITGRTY